MKATGEARRRKPNGPQSIPLGKLIHEKERQAANLMRMSATMQAQAIRLYTEIALLGEERG